MVVTTADLSARMTVECGTSVSVSWRFRLFQLVCRRVDGEPLTPQREAAFDRLLQLVEQLAVHVHDARI
jgi:hypothetical protein